MNAKTIATKIKIAASAAAILMSAQAAAADFQAAITDFGDGRTYGGYSASTNGETIGWSFSSTQSIWVNALGWFSPDGDLDAAHEVGIWELDGTLIASVIVQAGPTSDDGFSYANVDPFHLGQGSYLIGGRDRLRDGDNYVHFTDSVTTVPQINYLAAARSANGSGFAAPTLLSNGNGRFGPNFRFSSTAVPEPASWILLFLGFAGVGMALRSGGAARGARLRLPPA